MSAVTLALEHFPGDLEVALGERTLIRALHEIEGLSATADFPGDLALLRSTLRAPDYSPFLSCECDGDGEFRGEETKTARFRVVLPRAQAAGLEVGRVWASGALASIDHAAREV